jgi:NitT/TauT family transport system permease protein
MRDRVTRVSFLILLLGVWQFLFTLRFWPPYIFPSPVSVAQSLWAGLTDGTFPLAVAVSLRRMLIGYGISLILGLLLGLLLGRSRLVEQALGSVILGLQALPSICWLPLAILWFGLSETAILFVVVMGAVLSITLATADGVRNTPPIYIRAARTLGSGGARLYRDVVFPAALPAILSGMKLGWSFAWRSLMAGELLYVSLGLGQLLSLGRELNDMSRVLAVMLVIVAIGLAVDRLLFRPAEERTRERWGLLQSLA